MNKLMIIIPAYNEEGSLEVVVDNIRNNFPQYSYVVINDGSSDSTLDICRKNKYNYINLPINLGLENGIKTGMKYAYRKGYDYVIQLDADGQHLPEYIAPMLKAMEEGNDVVIGSRFVTAKKDASMRMIGSRLIAAAIKLTTGKTIKDPTSGMRMYNRKCMEAFAKVSSLGPEPDTVAYFIKHGMKVTEVQAEMKERETGSSYLTPFKSIAYMFRMMISILIIQNYKK